MYLVRFCLWPLKRHHGTRPLSVAGELLHFVCSHRSAGLASSSVPSSVPTRSACDVAHPEKESTTERKQLSGVNTSSAERLDPSAGGCEDNDPSRACEALLGDADDAASPLLSTALRPTSREARSGQRAELPTSKEPPPKSARAVAMEEFAALEHKLAARATPKTASDAAIPPPRKSSEQVAMEEFAALERKPTAEEPPPKSASAVAMEEFAALERKLAARTTPKPASHAAPPPKKKSAEQVAMEEFAALERKLGGVDADPVRRTRQDGPRKARLSSVARPKEPEAEECCGNGCSNCVWIDYWNELQDWEEAETQQRREKAPP